MTDSKAKTAERVTRPTPRRQEPVRHVSMAFRSPPQREQEPVFDGVVENAVKTAYRVFDEYMKRGEQAAWGTRPPQPGESTMGQDQQDTAASAMRFWQDMWTMYARNMQQMMQQGMQGMQGMQSMQGMPWMQGMPMPPMPWMTGAPWMSWMSAAAGNPSAWDTNSGGQASNPWAAWMPSAETAQKGWATDSDGSSAAASTVAAATLAATAAAHGNARPAARARAVTVDVQTTSAHRAEVSFTVYRPTAGKLELGAIEAADGKSKLSSKAARLIQSEEGARIALKFYPRQSAGTYTGVVRDESGEVCGALKVVLHDLDA